MPSRQIFCFNCRTYLGEIRDARLRKDINHACADCADRILRLKAATRLHNATKAHTGKAYGDVLKDLFNW